MSALTDLRDWARRQARDLERRIEAQGARVDSIADPTVAGPEDDLLQTLIKDQLLWADMADSIDSWLDDRDVFATTAAATTDRDPEATFSDFLFETGARS